jgi:hypothetical protein
MGNQYSAYDYWPPEYDYEYSYGYLVSILIDTFIIIGVSLDVSA